MASRDSLAFGSSGPCSQAAWKWPVAGLPYSALIASFLLHTSVGATSASALGCPAHGGHWADGQRRGGARPCELTLSREPGQTRAPGCTCLCQVAAGWLAMVGRWAWALEPLPPCPPAVCEGPVTGGQEEGLGAALVWSRALTTGWRLPGGLVEGRAHPWAAAACAEGRGCSEALRPAHRCLPGAPPAAQGLHVGAPAMLRAPGLLSGPGTCSCLTRWSSSARGRATATS